MRTESTTQGLVSVIIPTYNRYDMLHIAIKSVLEQTYQNIEVIVVNDCSTDARYYDGSLEKYEKTKVIHLPKNQREVYNVAAAQGVVRQFGIERASGEWIAFLDDDDLFLGSKIETQLNALADSQYLMCSTNMYTINGNREIFGIYLKQNLPSVFTRDLIVTENYINNSTVIVHKTILDKAGPCRLIDAEDWDLWKRCLEHTNCIYISDPLVLYMMGQMKYYKYVS
jgi:glycosyltransferase involved in cell wall biosynthesis